MDGSNGRPVDSHRTHWQHRTHWKNGSDRQYGSNWTNIDGNRTYWKNRSHRSCVHSDGTDRIHGTHGSNRDGCYRSRRSHGSSRTYRVDRSKFGHIHQSDAVK